MSTTTSSESLKTEQLPEKSVGEGGVLGEKKHAKSDMRMLRMLARHPLYVPNRFFTSGAEKMMAIMENEEYDPRARATAGKVVLDFIKTNLEIQKFANGDDGKDKSGGDGAGGQAIHQHLKVIVNLPDTSGVGSGGTQSQQAKVVEAEVVDNSPAKALKLPPASTNGKHG